MNNFDDWALYTKDIQSPQAWVDASFYFMMGAALQRRVWFGGLDSSPLFPNLFISFVGPPSAGKSLIISPMKDVLNVSGEIPGNSAASNDLSFDSLAEQSEQYEGARKPLVYIAPNSTTFEQMTQEVSKTVYLHRYKSESGITKAYAHSSVVFILDELTSIFKRNSEDLTNFLLEAFNSGKSYKRKLKTGPSDYCNNICVSLIGNTTNEKFRSMQNTDILTDGFMARTILIYADKKRFNLFQIPELTDEQRAAKVRLQAHVRKLSKLYGQVKFSPEATTFFQDIFELHPEKIKTNPCPLLDGYFGRKNIHVQKLAMAAHFSEETTMEISLATSKRALDVLESWERSMHIPYVGMGRNETAQIAEDIFNHIASVKVGLSRRSLFVKFFSQLKTLQELDVVLADLQTLQRIKITNGLYVKH